MLPDGTVIAWAGKHMDADGYDLPGLLTGSECVLGVITEVTVRILPRPETARGAARLRQQHQQVSVASAAERAGYETEAAFRKAFRRVQGVGPGAIRRWFRQNVGGADPE